MSNTQKKPLVVALLIVLFVIGTIASLCAVVSLTFPGSFLELLWRVNPHAREAFAQMGGWSVVVMSVVFVACLLTAIGLWRRLSWSYWLAVVMLSLNLLGDAINVITGTERRAIVGIPIALTLLFYLLKKKTKDYFRRSS
jgi:hypothetical protein